MSSIRTLRSSMRSLQCRVGKTKPRGLCRIARIALLTASKSNIGIFEVLSINIFEVSSIFHDTLAHSWSNGRIAR